MVQCSWIYNYLCCQFLSPLTPWCQWFSLGSRVSSTNKTDIHDITEILLKVVLNTITLQIIYLYIGILLYVCLFFHQIFVLSYFKKTYYFFTGSLLFMYLMVPAIKFWVKKRRYIDPKNDSSLTYLILSQ